MASFDWSSTLNSALPAVLGAGGVGGLWALLTERAKGKAATAAASAKATAEAPADMLDAMSAFQRALNEQTKQLTGDLRREIEVQAKKLDRAETRIGTLERENEVCQREAVALRGELRDVRQRADSLESILRRAGVDMPEKQIPGSFAVFEGDRTTVLAPTPTE